MKRKITEISVFEFFMCIFVITIHLMSEGAEQFTRWSVSSISFYTITRLISFAVPGFVFTSAIKIFYKYSKKRFSYPKFLLGRILKVFIPYVVAVVIYYVFYVYVLKLEGYEKFKIDELIGYIFRGDLSAQFYFVILIMQFYILMPLWLLISKVRSKGFALGTLISMLVITILSRMYFTTWGAGILNWLANLNLPFTNPLSGYVATEHIQEIASFTNKFFTSYLIFWIGGMYIGLNYDSFAEKIVKAKPVIYIGWLVLAVTHCILAYMKFCGAIKYSLEPVIVVLFCIFAIAGFYMYVKNLTETLEKNGKGFLMSIADASYYIYLIHCLVITSVYVWLKEIDIVDPMTRFWITAGITYVFSIVFSVLVTTIHNNFKVKRSRKSAAKARQMARRKRYL